MFTPAGKIQKRPAPNPDGSPYPIELPVLRSATGVATPCGVCPKIPPGRPKDKTQAVEFDGWFWELFDWYREGKAVGFEPNLSPVMRAVAAEFADHEQLAARADLAAMIAMANRKGK